MNKVKQTLWGFTVSTVTALGLGSCDSEFVEEQEPETWNTCKLVFDASKESFDDETRTTAYEWKDGEFVYLLFSNGVRPITGKAVYKASSKEWTLEYFGSLDETSSAKCKACDIKGNYTSIEELAALSPNAALYLDTLATYSKTGNIVKVTANLKPQTGRLRFKGKVGSQFKVAGLRFYSSYSFKTNKTAYEDSTFSCTIGEDGYSPYIYAVMPAKHRLLRVFNSDTIFVTKCADNVLANGKSGYLDVPTESAHYGWEKWINMPITVGNSTFKMIYVEGGTFKMGATEEQGSDAQDNEKPVHDVTLSSYYIMETEVTQGLYRDVMGTDPYEWKGEKYPVLLSSHDDVIKFVNTLNEKTNRKFSVSSEAQWEFAARGGVVSNGYKYSGSDYIDDVAWYKENSNNSTHDVQQKRPNELGIYDMTGNGYEGCGWYEKYSSAPQTNPIGPTSTSDKTSVVRGGCYYETAGKCRNSSRGTLSYYGTGYKLRAIRLTLIQ